MVTFKFDMTPPTRQCLVCHCREDPNRNLINEGAAWLCPTCRGVLSRLVDEAVTRGDGDD